MNTIFLRNSGIHADHLSRNELTNYITSSLESKVREGNQEVIDEILEDWNALNETKPCPFSPEVMKILNDIRQKNIVAGIKSFIDEYNAMTPEKQEEFRTKNSYMYKKMVKFQQTGQI